MALFHLNVSNIGKSKGSSAVAAAAYRSCSQLIQYLNDSNYDLSSSIVHRFDNKKGLAFSYIFAPEGLDSWCYDRQSLWNKVEESETRKDARFARDIKLALQKEFTLEQNIQILSEYVTSVFVSQGIIADVNIHMDNKNNPHAHIMLTTRKLIQDDNGNWVFGHKNRLLDTKEWIRNIREEWAHINNYYFALFDIDKSITADSYETRGFRFLTSTIHEGAAMHTENSSNAVHERTEFNRNAVVKNLNYIRDNPLAFITAVIKDGKLSESTFSKESLLKNIDKFLEEIALRNESYHELIAKVRMALEVECDRFLDSSNNDLISNTNLNTKKDKLAAKSNELVFEGDTSEVFDKLFKNTSLSANNNNFGSPATYIDIDEELEYIKQNSDNVISILNQNKAVFSKNDLIKQLNEYIDKNILSELNDNNKKLLNEAKVKITNEFNNILAKFLHSEELIKLVDKDLSNNEIYTTKSQIILEKEFLNNIEELNNSDHHSVKHPHPTDTIKISNNINTSLKSLSHKLSRMLPVDAKSLLDRIVCSILGKKHAHTLTAEQQEAVKKLLVGKDIIALSGMPGTGKSTVMERVAIEYRKMGYQVLGGSLSAVAALNLGTEAKINSYTLSKWQYDWKLREEIELRGEKPRDLLPTLNNKTVFIVDEMSMVDLKLASYITSKVKQAGAKLICIYDNNQFSSMGIGGASEKIAEKVENVTLTELFRQAKDIDKKITRKLSNYQVDLAIETLDDEGRIKFCDNKELIRQELVNQYIYKIHSKSSSSPSSSNNESIAIIAYKNEEVKDLNLLVRERLLSSGLLYTKNYDGKEKRGREFIGTQGKMPIAIDERIVFTKNHKFLGVLNGQLGKVIEIIDDTRFKVELLNEKQSQSVFSKGNNIVVINNEKFTHFDYGYAITAHKSQGKTYHYSYILLDSSVGYEAFNVMATRHKQNSEFYIDKNTLNDIILRKLDKSSNHGISGVSFQGNENQLTNNQKAALYEMLVKRAPRIFAHDYIDYDKKNEIIQIRKYLTARDSAAATYRELLKWKEAIQNEITHDGGGIPHKAPNLWDNEELWNKFTQLTTLRKSAAEEIVENYSIYQKYIDPSLINYSTLVKHAGKNSLEFDYQEITNHDRQNISIDVENHNDNTKAEALREYNEVVKLADSLAKNYSKKTEKLLIAKTEDLLSTHHEHQLNLEKLVSKISSLENEKWLLESKKNTCNYYKQDFIKYLDETYKEGGEKTLGNWNKIVKELGLKKAIDKIINSPEILGDLAGVGIGQKLAVTDKRAIAVFNLKTLEVRINKYQSALEQTKDLGSQINKIETTQLAPLKETYYKLASSIILSKEKEDHLHDILDNKDSLKDWLKTQHESNNIQGHNDRKDKYQQALNSTSKLQDKNSSIEIKFSSYNKISYSDLHNKLCDNIIELTKDLLPLISNKNIEISKQAIKCGSINVSLESETKGLWCRFSRENEKGDLFDLIKISKGTLNKQEAIAWSKAYLGINSSLDLSSHVSEKSIERTISGQDIKDSKDNKELRILIPSPETAKIFNPEKLFMYKLKDGSKVIEGVYAYKNIENQLCGYVVRMKDLKNGTKETLPVVYTENSQGVKSWKSRGFGENRCLYNEHLLQNSTKPVLIVEGEKTADAAQKLYSEVDVVSWSGGTNGYIKSNWNVLSGKEVVIWPDNDQTGIKAAENIKKLLEEKNITKAKIVDISKIEFLPEKWDLADESPEDVREYQITNALLKALDISADKKIDRIVNSYIEHRQSLLKHELNLTRIDNLNEYLIENEQIKYKLEIEEKLAKSQLQEKENLSTFDEIDISLESRKIVSKKIETLKSAEKLELNDMYIVIEQELKDSYMHIDASKLNLAEIAKIAVTQANILITEHNNSQHHTNINAYMSKGGGELKNNHLLLSKDSLPVLALSFARQVLRYNEDNSTPLNVLHSSSAEQHINNNLSLEHSVNIVRSSFKLQLAHDTMNYNNHHQQQMQKQIVQHYSAEI